MSLKVFCLCKLILRVCVLKFRSFQFKNVFKKSTFEPFILYTVLLTELNILNEKFVIFLLMIHSLWTNLKKRFSTITVKNISWVNSRIFHMQTFALNMIRKIFLLIVNWQLYQKILKKIIEVLDTLDLNLSANPLKSWKHKSWLKTG